jgi:hypothetical protein
MPTKKVVRTRHAAARPYCALYSTSATVRVAIPNRQRYGRATTLPKAVRRAVERIETGEFSRCDIYNDMGVHVRSVIDYPKIGIAIIRVRVPARIEAVDPPVRRTPGNKLTSWQDPWFIHTGKSPH